MIIASQIVFIIVILIGLVGSLGSKEKDESYQMTAFGIAAIFALVVTFFVN